MSDIGHNTYIGIETNISLDTKEIKPKTFVQKYHR